MSWLDILPSSERARVRKKLRSPAAYEKLRQSVKGPEQIEAEMQKNEALAELRFALETEPVVQEKLKQQVEEDVGEQGLEAIFEVSGASPEALQKLQNGAFEIQVEAPENDQEQIVALPEGLVSEKIPFQPRYSEKFTGSLST